MPACLSENIKGAVLLQSTIDSVRTYLPKYTSAKSQEDTQGKRFGTNRDLVPPRIPQKTKQKTTTTTTTTKQQKKQQQQQTNKQTNNNNKIQN